MHDITIINKRSRSLELQSTLAGMSTQRNEAPFAHGILQRTNLLKV